MTALHSYIGFVMRSALLSTDSSRYLMGCKAKHLQAQQAAASHWYLRPHCAFGISPALCCCLLLCTDSRRTAAAAMCRHSDCRISTVPRPSLWPQHNPCCVLLCTAVRSYLKDCSGSSSVPQSTWCPRHSPAVCCCLYCRAQVPEGLQWQQCAGTAAAAAHQYPRPHCSLDHGPTVWRPCHSASRASIIAAFGCCCCWGVFKSTWWCIRGYAGSWQQYRQQQRQQYQQQQQCRQQQRRQQQR